MEQKMQIQQTTNILAVSFDDIPVGRKSNKNMFLDEHPQNFIDQPVVQQKPSLDKRLQSKLWKMRQQAYQQLNGLMEQNEQIINQYQEQLIKFISDNNLSCQQKAFKLLDTYAKKTKKINLDINILLKILIQKGITAAKLDIIKYSQNIIFELFQKGHKQEIYKSINQNLAHKNPKVICCCMDFIIHLLRQFGLKKLDMLKPFFKQIQKHNEATSSNIKNSFINFYKEVYKWVGDNLFSLTNKLKKNQIEQIEKFAKGYTKVPMVATRINQKQSSIQQKKEILDLDPYEISEPVDIITKYDENWTEKILALQKWIQKKDALDLAYKQWDTPKILVKDYYHLTAFLKRILADNNINIQICAIKLLSCLAKGLRKNFSQGARIFSSLLIYKLKDKKHQIVEQIQKTLKNMLYCITIEDMMQYIKEGLNDKAPNMRIEVLKFLEGNISKKQQKAIKLLLDPLIKLISDSSAEVRDKLFEVLGKIKMCFGNPFFGDRFKDITNQKLTKILNQKIDEQKNQKLQKVEKKQLVAPKPISINMNTINNVSNFVPTKQQVKKLQVNIKQMAIQETKYEKNNEINISHPNQNTRLLNYQTLLQKINFNTFNLLKSKSIKQSSPNILKIILMIIHKIFHQNQINRQCLEYLLWHDWRKSKNLFIEFLQNINLNPQCNQLIKNNSFLRDILQKQIKPKPHLITQLHALIPKMSNPNSQARLHSLQSALMLLDQYKNIETDYNPYINQINQLCNAIKCRIQDKQVDIVKGFILLARNMTKAGIITKTRGRIILPTIISKLSDQTVIIDARSYLEQALQINANYVFSHFPLLLSQQPLKIHILSFIENNAQKFIASADLKTFIIPLLNCLKQRNQVYFKAQRLLDQIIQINGQSILEKTIKQHRFVGAQAYMQKWGLQRIKNVEPGKLLLTKADRLKQQPSNPWPLTPSPTHIQQLLILLQELPYPFPALATPLPVNIQYINILMQSNLLVQYSDIIVKWLFWRFQIERKESVVILIDLAKKLIILNLELMEISILLSGLVGAITLGPEVLQAVCQLNQQFRKINYYQKVLLFWINIIKQTSAPINQILYIIRNSFQDILSNELINLATIPAVRNNKDFLQFLKKNYDIKLLKVYGFDVEQKNFRSKFIKVQSQNQITIDQNIIQAFKTQRIENVIELIQKQLYQRSPQEVVSFHSNLLQSIIMLFLNKEITATHFINYFTYFNNLILNFSFQNQIITIARTLIALLIDLDETKPENSTYLIKMVNNTVLKLLEIIPFQSMCNALLIILKEQLARVEYNKTIAIISKCISRITRCANFTSSLVSNYEWFLEQVLKILDQNYFNYTKNETQFHKNLRVTLTEICRNYPNQTNAINDIIFERHKQNYFTKQFLSCFSKKPQLNNIENGAQIYQNKLKQIKNKFGYEQISEIPNIYTKKSLE